jgi:carboxymethylenebutenolidase
MGEFIQLSTSRQQCIGAYLAKAQGRPRGGIVVVQEIFGVNAWVRGVVDRFAAAGYTTIAPAFFDHVETGVELGYGADGSARGRALVGEIGFERAVEDVASAAQAIVSAGKIGVVGYCWGGTIALLAATRLGLPAVSYYGARNVQVLDEPLGAPVQFHFGGRDDSIPPPAVQRHRDQYSAAIAAGEVEIHVYPDAGHAFDRDVDTGHFDATGSAVSRERTYAFLAKHLAA